LNGVSLRIISGGQRGVDRAALDFAVEHDIAYGGWCPKGGRAEDIRDPPGLLARYPHLSETPEVDPKQRTEWNVRDADATLIIVPVGASSPGSDFTIDCTKQYAKPCLVIDPTREISAEESRLWLRSFPSLSSLNIAGPRESECLGIYTVTRAFLENVFSK